MRPQFLQLMAHVLFDVLKGKKECRRDCRSPTSILDSRAQILLAGVHQPAVGVIDDHEFLGFEEVVRYQQRAQAIVGHNAASVADNMRVASCQAECADGKPRVHASKNGKLSSRPRSQIPQLMRSRVNLIRFENFVNHAHCEDSLAWAVGTAACDCSIPLLSYS